MKLKAILAILGASLYATGNTVAASKGELTLKVESRYPVAIVPPAQADEASVQLRNGTGDEVSGELRLGMRERPGDTIELTHTRSVTIRPDADVRVPLPRDLIGDLGVKYLDWKLEAGGNDQSGMTRFAHMDPVGASDAIQTVPPEGPDDFIYGIAGGIRFHYDRDFKERFLRAAAIIGAEAYRCDLSWNVLQPEPDKWRWEGLDELVSVAEKNGMFVQPLVAYGNPWAVSDATRKLAKKRGELNRLWRYPPKPEPWGEFVRRIAARYGTRMQYYEIWNEPDIFFFKGTAAQYLTLLKTAYREIKAVDPAIEVTTGGFTAMAHPELDRELQKLALTEGRQSFDAIAWHRHGDFDGFQKEIDEELLPWLRELGHENTPLVFNESAVGKPFEKEWELATQLVKKMTFTRARGAIGHYWYNLMRSAPDYQMLKQDWTPRPSYPAYNQLIRMLRGRRFSHDLDLGPGRWGFVFRGQGDFTGNSDADWVVVAWQQDGTSAEGPIPLDIGPEASVERVDLMGNPKSIALDKEGRARLRIDREPAYWVIDESNVAPRHAVGEN